MDDSPYIKAQERQREAVTEWCEHLNDPFKAPELKVGLPSDVFNAVVEVIAEHSLITSGRANGS
jgi:hypothetical protein